MPRIYSQATYVLQWLRSEPKMTKPARTGRYYELQKTCYFRRVWVVQEYLLAQRVYTLCGDVVLRFEEFPKRIWQTARIGALKQGGLYLELCLFEYSSKACENPRDKVYGLLRLVRAEEQVPVDYRKSVLVVYLDTVEVLNARAHLEHNRRLQYTDGSYGRLSPSLIAARRLARNMGLVRDDVDIFFDSSFAKCR
jgi:hypothetical protein